MALAHKKKLMARTDSAGRTARQTQSSTSPAPPPDSPVIQIEARSGDPNFVTSLARGLTVIQAFSQHQQPLTISQLSISTGLSRAAVRRCLYTLTKLGFAASDYKRHFVLQPKVLSLGYSYISSTPLASAAQPILDRLSGAVHESCSIAVLEAGDIVYIARANVTRIMSVHLGIGSRLPAFCTSMGRVLLAYLPENELETCLTNLKFKRYTDRTLTSVDKLRQTLRTVRKNAFAIVDQELELGLRSMAVPIQNRNGKVEAALNVGMHAQRVSVQEMQAKFLPHLRSAAQELSVLLK